MQNQKGNKAVQENAAVDSTLKESYVKPEAEVLKLELEQPILAGSAPGFGNGGDM